MSKVMSIGVMVLVALGFLFIILRALDIIEWRWFWVVMPIFVAVVIYVILVIMAVILGLEI